MTFDPLNPIEVTTNVSNTPPIQHQEINTFSRTLDFHMREHGETAVDLCKGIVLSDENFTSSTLTAWRRGAKFPRTVKSFEILGRIEKRYGLPPNYFKQKLPHSSRASLGHKIANINAATLRRMAWHLPDDFERRSPSEKAEIINWVQTVIISKSTSYRQYHAKVNKIPYSIQFPLIMSMLQVQTSGSKFKHKTETRSLQASNPLLQEVADLVKFKTAPLTPLGYERNGVWTNITAHLMVSNLGLFYGALVTSSPKQINQLHISHEQLCLALLAFPKAWDWYLNWRRERRGFYTNWEANMLRMAASLVNKETGWLRQNPQLAENLKPIKDLITEADILAAQNDWNGICDLAYRHFSSRWKEVRKLSRVHRDPFEPILPILEAESPLKEYLKIADEVIRYLPDEKIYPKFYAEGIRSFLMLRIGLHSGLRQKNIRQLLFCPRHGKHSSERSLTDKKCGELRWCHKDNVWEIFIPAIAFKNANSSFFGTKPFKLALPDLGDLYKHLEDYIDKHRQQILGWAEDPGTFFVKTAKVTSANAAYSQADFYNAWRSIIQRYGIYNPYTKRGVISGLLPHGPHNIRDVLATHILKVTGSYEQASYAIQDTPEMVAKHYGRFLPQNKSALAAKILNEVWNEDI